MRQIRHSPIHLPGVAAVLFWLDGEAALFYRVRPPWMKLHPSVTFAALLQQLQACFPTTRGSSGHRPFVSAFMPVR